MADIKLDAEQRTEFGKGAARRTRRAGKIPAVLYGHGTDPQHLALPALEFARVIRENGRNAVLTINVEGREELALTKTVATHPIRYSIEHVDLLVIRRGEKVVVEVTVHITGSAAPGSLVTQELNTLEVEADVSSIPEYVEVSVDGLAIGTQILAGSITMPANCELRTDPEALVVNVNAAPTEEDMEAEVDAEGAGVVEDAPETESDEDSDESSEEKSDDEKPSES